MDAWIPISALVPVKYLPNLLSKLSIFSLALAGFSLALGVKAAFRDSEHVILTQSWMHTYQLRLTEQFNPEAKSSSIL